MNPDEFLSPGNEYRGVTLWMLNDDLELQEVRRQLKEFHSVGWGAVITRTFVGLRTPYLSDEWMRIIEEIIGLCKELRMRVWLQAGYMPSAIPDLEKAFKQKVVRKAKKGPHLEHEKILLEEDSFTYYQTSLDSILDLLNPEAVKTYLEKAYEVPWFDRFRKEFGKTVETVWVDEPHFKPPLLPWSNKLPELFKQKWGYSITENLPSLFSKVGDFRKVRHHYWRTITQMFLDAYTRQVGQWCAVHKVKFSGHLMGEDTLHSQISWTAAAMPHYEFMQLPGIDHLTLSLLWPLGTGKFLMTPKQCSSVANQLGKKEILSEMYGVSSQGITFEDRKWIGDWLMLLGINYRCFHGSFYSIRGRRKRIYVPHLSYQQPWWEDNRIIADYFARLSYALRQGRYRADVLVLHPIESAFCIYDQTQTKDFHDRTKEPDDIRALNDSLVCLTENLLKIHRGFEYGDESLMAEYSKITKRSLSVGEMTYKVVILPSLITLRKTTTNLLIDFIKTGGIVFSVGELPSRIEGELDENIHEFKKVVRKVKNDPYELKEALEELVPVEIEITTEEGINAENIWVHARQLNRSRLFFLANTSRTQALESEVKIRGLGKLEYWDLRTGEVKSMPQHQDGELIVTNLSFPPTASHLILLKDDEDAVDIHEKEYNIVRTYNLPHKKRVRRYSPNAITLDFCRFRKGDGEWRDILPIIGVQELLDQELYEGPLTLQFGFVADIKPEHIFVVIEDAEEFTIKVNRKTVKYTGLPYYVDRSFHPVDITDKVQLGENIIEISRHFQPLVKPTFRLASLFESLPGVELESIYLIGDFAVNGMISLREQKPKCVRYQPNFVLSEEPKFSSGDLIIDGYPFLTGRISLVSTINLAASKGDERIVLKLSELNAVIAKIWVNSKEAGSIVWPPYQIDITHLVQDGENEIEIELTNSLRNLLGPHHRPSGEPTSTWGTDFSGAWSRVEKKHYPDWFQDWTEGVCPNWTDDYFFVPFDVSGEVKIEYQSIK